MGFFSRKSDVERRVEDKLEGRSARANAKGLTAAQIVALQCKASDAKNKRKGR